MQYVFNRGPIQVGLRFGAAMFQQLETRRERLDGSFHAVAAYAAQFHQVVGSGNSYEEPPVFAEDPPEFRWIHARRDR